MIATTNLAPTSPDLSPAPPRNFATSAAAAAANANLKIVYNDAGPAQVVVPSSSSAAAAGAAGGAGGEVAGSALPFVGADGYCTFTCSGGDVSFQQRRCILRGAIHVDMLLLYTCMHILAELELSV